MRILAIQNWPTVSLGTLEEKIAERGIPYTLVRPDLGQTLPDPAGFDAILIGGMSVSANDGDRHPFLDVERTWLRRAIQQERPCFGICGGAQLLALALGAGVRRNAVPEIGIYDVQTTEEGRRDPMLMDLPSPLPVFHWHRDTFDIPTGGRLLLEGAHCRNQMFRHGRVVGVQFHPEITSEMARLWAVEFADDLKGFSKTAEEILAECAGQEDAMRASAGRLLDNFLSLSGDLP